MPEQTSMQAINREIRANLARRGLNQGDLVRALGVSQASVSARLTGETEWKLSEIVTVAQTLNMTVGQLVDVAPARLIQRSA